jgi:hypothetical protein
VGRFGGKCICETLNVYIGIGSKKPYQKRKNEIINNNNFYI